MQTWGELVSADEARRRFFSAWSPTDVKEEVEVPDGLGRVLAESIVATEDLPPFSRSLMDGFACRAVDLVAVPVRLRLVGAVEMGQRAQVPVEAWEAIQVPTGGMLPPGSRRSGADRVGGYHGRLGGDRDATCKGTPSDRTWGGCEMR